MSHENLNNEPYEEKVSENEESSKDVLSTSDSVASGYDADNSSENKKSLPNWAKSSNENFDEDDYSPKKKRKKKKRNMISPWVAILFLFLTACLVVLTIYSSIWAYGVMIKMLNDAGIVAFIVVFFCWIPFFVPLICGIFAITMYISAVTCGILSRHTVIGKVILGLSLLPILLLVVFLVITIT